MKKLFSTLIAFFALAVAFAQTDNLPNAGFEDWTDNTTPVGWNGSFNTIIPIYNGMANAIVDYKAANKSTQAHTGDFAIEVIPQKADIMYNGNLAMSYPLPGIVQLGRVNVDALQNVDFSNITNINNLNIADFAIGGLACNQLPDSVTAWVRFATVNDSLRAGVLATRWENGQRQVVAQGEYLYKGAISEYTQITIPSAVKAGMEGIEPDTVNIIFSCGSMTVDTASRLYIDDVALYTSVVIPTTDTTGTDTTDTPGTDTTAIFSIDNLPVFSVMPNPATDVMTIVPLTNGEYTLRLYDMNGRIVRELTGLQNETRLNVSDLNKGVYFLQVKQGTNVKTQKVVVK